MCVSPPPMVFRGRWTNQLETRRVWAPTAVAVILAVASLGRKSGPAWLVEEEAPWGRAVTSDRATRCLGALFQLLALVCSAVGGSGTPVMLCGSGMHTLAPRFSTVVMPLFTHQGLLRAPRRAGEQEADSDSQRRQVRSVVSGEAGSDCGCASALLPPAPCEVFL